MTSSIERVADFAHDRGISIAAAESLTSGALAGALGKGEDASEWFAGGVVAYFSRVKFEVLGVDEGPVITERCAEQMAEGVRRLLRADAAVAVTGAGGPDAEEGKPPGTVFIAASVHGRVVVKQYSFDGDPGTVVEKTVESALGQLAAELDKGHA